MKKLIIISLLILPFLANAQEEVPEAVELTPCVQNIELAQQRYNEGRIQDIQNLLQDCLDREEYDKVQKSQALRLLTLAHIYLEDEESAEATMLELLNANHEFQVDPSIDPTEFINLHERFRYKPLFNVGVRYIANLSQPMVKELNSAFDLNNSTPEYVPSISIFSIGVNFEYEFIENLVLYPEIHYRTMTVNRTHSTNNITSSDATFATTNNVDNTQWLSLPVSVKYNIHLKNIPSLKFYVNLGGSVDYLLNSTKPGDGATLVVTNAPATGSTQSALSDKNRLNFGLIGGGGITFKAGEGFISLEARYLYNFNRLQKSENIIVPNEPALMDPMLQDDIYNLNHIALSLGYTLNIYLPKQLR